MRTLTLPPSHFYRLHNVTAGGWTEVWNADDNCRIGLVAKTKDEKGWIALVESEGSRAKYAEPFRSRHAACLALVRFAAGVYADEWSDGSQPATDQGGQE